MYAIIRSGGKQTKVSLGDVVDVERLKGAQEEVEFTPLLVVDENGDTVTDRDALGKVIVRAKVLGEVRGDKIDVFKYKNKSGYRRRQGHRQRYTQLEITAIDMPSAKKAKSSTAKKKAEDSVGEEE
ncbi:MAG: 50S ribosomal protein L21 [Acidimicrobiia bacterium]|nr:50S ribosomal protein L21 [Acidimicrobiia bacterium]